MNAWLTVEAPVLDVRRDLPLRSGHTWSQIILSEGGEELCINCWDNGGALPPWVQPGVRLRADVHVRSRRTGAGSYYTTCTAGSIEPGSAPGVCEPPQPVGQARAPMQERPAQTATKADEARAPQQAIPAGARPDWAEFRRKALDAAGFKL